MIIPLKIQLSQIYLYLKPQNSMNSSYFGTLLTKELESLVLKERRLLLNCLNETQRGEVNIYLLEGHIKWVYWCIDVSF